uniref:Mitofilin n=1 Tax=Syphacia muris TaxID=451379 RepID=A0A0N5AMK9_9BILA
MLSRNASAYLTRNLVTNCLTCCKRYLLSTAFSLDDDWSQRSDSIYEITKGRNYEWIAAIQKKYAAGTIPSAVDVDIAVCGATDGDQANDVVDLIYKLRHSKNASNILPSTEYGAIRYCLQQNNTDILLRFVNDPINYGVFFNTHSGCLTLDYFLKQNNFKDAAKIASSIMKQEMFENSLLNFLCVYASLKWSELPVEQRQFSLSPSTEAHEEEANDEEKFFKFPFLKNEYFDNHFDLVDGTRLVGKTLLWTCEHLNLKPSLVRSIKLIGALYFGNVDIMKKILEEGSVFPASVDICKLFLSADERRELAEELMGTFNNAVKESDDSLLSKLLFDEFHPVLNSEEQQIVNEQRSLFIKWNDRRRTLISTQIEKVNHFLRLKEIEEEMKKLESEKEMRHFFENRLHWEDMAKSNDEIYEEFHLLEAKDKMTDEAYAKEIFEKCLLNWCVQEAAVLLQFYLSQTKSFIAGDRGHFLHPRLIAERLSESVHVVDHDPSLAFYRLQEHVGKSLPALNNRKYSIAEVNAALQGACFDLDNIICAVQSMEDASSRFSNIKNMLSNCEEYRKQLNLSNV